MVLEGLIGDGLPERREGYRGRLRRARPGERLLGPEDPRRLVGLLRRVRDLADERAGQLEAALGRQRGP